METDVMDRGGISRHNTQIRGSRTRVVDIHQVFLQTADLDRAVGFYRSLGLDVADEGSRSVEFETGHAQLKLQADFDPETLSGFGLDPPGENRGAGSVVVVGVEDVDAIAESADDAVEEYGGEVLAGPRDVDWGRRLLLVADPDGYVLEFSHPRTE